MRFFGNNRLAGAGYVVLNVIRVMNIISLLAVMAASAVLLVKTINTNSFFFFDAVEHVSRLVIAGFCIITELPIFRGYISKNWPLFSSTHGFVTLGGTMLLLGNSILAMLNKAEGSQDRLGLAFWRLVIGSGIVVLFMGTINVAASYIFRNRSQGLTARHVRSNGATASHKLEVESSISASTPKQSRRSRYKSLFLPHKHRDSLPSYYSSGKNNNSRSEHPAMTQTQTGAGKQPSRSPYQNFSQFGMHTTSPGGKSAGGGSSVNDPFTSHLHPHSHAVHHPVSPSSKYSTDDMGISRPDPAQHPAYSGRPF